MTTREYGRLIKFDSTVKGYGFIEADLDGAQYFVHMKDFDAAKISPEVGMRLLFELEPAPRHPGKLRACNLSRDESPHYSADSQALPRGFLK